MSTQGASLQYKLQELITTVENQKKKKFNLQKVIEVKKEEKGQIEREIEQARLRAGEIDTKLAALNSALADLDSSIRQSEDAFSKIIENADLLLAIHQKTGGAVDKII